MSQTVLLIDDSSIDRSIYRRLLCQDHRQSYQIIEFDNGEAALDWCKKNKVDVILLDYLLPQMDGLELLRRLRQQHSAEILPIILLTGVGTTKIAVEALKLGAQDYLEKDQVTQENLSQLVWSVLQQVQLKRQLACQQAQQQVVNDIALQMRQSLDPQNILNDATQKIRQFLEADRVLVYQFAPDWSGLVIAESVDAEWPSVLAQQIQDTCFHQGMGLGYQQGRVWAVADREEANLPDCYRQLLAQFAVKANLVVPILQCVPTQADPPFTSVLWGLLIVHHCAGSHEWEAEEIDFLQQVAVQLSGAIQQATLYQQAQKELAERKLAELALKESEEKLRLLIKHAPVSIAMFDREMRYIMASQRWLDAHSDDARTIEDYLGLSHYEIYPDIPERWRQVHQRCLAGAIEKCDEDLFVKAGVPLQWVRWEVRPWYSATGEIGGIVIFSEEITSRKQAEIALSESEARLRLAQSASQSAVWDWNLVTNQLIWTPEYYQLYELDPSIEPTYETWLNCIHPDDRAEVNQKTLHVLASAGSEVRREFRVIRSDGIRWFASIGQVLRDEAGKPIRMIGITIDVTSQKQTEIALQESEARFRAAILEAPIPVKLHAEDGEILLVNQTWTELTGYTHADIPTIAEWTEKAYGTRKDEMQAMIRDHFLLQERSCVGEFSLTTKSGDIRIWNFYTAPLGTLPDGRKFLISTAVDCTEQRLAQTQLQSILDSSEVVVFVKDRDGKYLLINQQYEMLTGMKREALLGGTDFDVYPTDVAEVLRHNDQHVLITGESLQFEETVPLAEGSRTYLALKFPLYDANGRIYAVCGMSTDITELKQAQNALHRMNDRLKTLNQDLERANDAKDAFLRMMNHELLTPLNPILGMAEGLRAEVFGALNDRQNRAVSTIIKKGESLLRMINGILDLVDLESGKIKLDCHAVLVQQLCQASISIIAPLAEAKSIQLQSQIEPGLNLIQVDSDRMKQVLVHLLENAIKFTSEHGTVTLKVKKRMSIFPVHAPGNVFVEFSVTDTGIGIAPENLQTLFQFFAQIDKGLSRRYEGVGIGLALARRLVGLHGGHVTVESQVGQGSCFTVRIPTSSQN